MFVTFSLSQNRRVIINTDKITQIVEGSSSVTGTESKYTTIYFKDSDRVTVNHTFDAVATMIAPY